MLQYSFPGRGRPSISSTILSMTGTLILTFAPFLVVPIVASLFIGEFSSRVALAFMLPALLATGLGFLLRYSNSQGPVRNRESLLLSVVAWALFSLFAAIPFMILLPGTPFIDALFEAVAGITTTGITLLSGLEQLPRVLLFFRAELQLLGGLGILTFFLVVTSRSEEVPFHLFAAENQNVQTPRLTPNINRSINMITIIYLALVLIFTGLYFAAGMSPFDSIIHSFTSIATGGFSNYDASIGAFQRMGYPTYALIEWVVILGMIAGGLNFFVHYRLVRGELSALWDSVEIKAFWRIAMATIALLLIGSMIEQSPSFALSSEHIRRVAFQTFSLITSTGYVTDGLSAAYFPNVARPLFLLLMIMGGPIASTSSGFKLLRVVILFESIKHEVRRLYLPQHAVQPLIIDGWMVPHEEVIRVAGLFMLWLTGISLTMIATLLLSPMGFLESLSASISVISNMGPMYTDVPQIAELSTPLKATYILGMLAGRLEIIPFLLVFSRRAWR